MSSSPSTSPIFACSLDHPNVDWIDVLGYFLDGDENNTKAVAESSHCQPESQPTPVTAPIHTENTQSPLCTSNVLQQPTEDVTVSEEPKLTADEKARIRSERKRSREKQRRSDVNTQFADLTALLKKIEAEDEPDEESRKSLLALSTSSNRVDLIVKTIAILNRIHNENRKRKRTIDELKEELKETQKRADDAMSKLEEKSQPSEKSDHVMMMVPMMIRPDGTAQAPFMPQTMPFYPMCQTNTDKNFMFNPFMFKQSSTAPQQSSEDKSAEPSKSSNQHMFTPAMVSMNMSNSGENLAHCA